MIIIIKPQSPQDKVEALAAMLRSRGFEIHINHCSDSAILGLVGDTSQLDINSLYAIDIVESVKNPSEPYEIVSRTFCPHDTQININGSIIGGTHFGVIAGPCSVESVEQIVGVAKYIKAHGGKFLRGGAFKPRTSPYTFQGLKAEGIEMLLEAKKETGLPVVSELTSLKYLDLFCDIDIIQVGARNMQNFEMLCELGHCGKPVLLKRGISSTVEELLMSAEYIVSSGNRNVILCERGIRTFETATRNTLDISSVPLLKQITHLPVIVDPSHATGKASLVAPMAKAAVVAGADGVIIEVHPDPENALCDGAQSISPDQFSGIMKDISRLCEFEKKLM